MIGSLGAHAAIGTVALLLGTFVFKGCGAGGSEARLPAYADVSVIGAPGIIELPGFSSISPRRGPARCCPTRAASLHTRAAA